MSSVPTFVYHYHDAIKAFDIVERSNARRLLIIEDNLSDVLLIKKMLRGVLCFNPIEFTDVPRLVDALRLFEMHTYDLVILDLNLLDMDGIAAVAAVRNEAPFTTIIVHSGSSDPTLKQQVLLCGAKHFLVKGCESPSSFKNIIKQSLTPALA